MSFHVAILITGSEKVLDHDCVFLVLNFSLIPTLYKELKAEGVDFPDISKVGLLNVKKSLQIDIQYIFLLSVGHAML